MNRSSIALLLLLAAPCLFAQDRGDGDSKPASAGAVTGFVTTVSGNLITLLNGAVTIDAAGADIQGRKGKGTIADVKPGSQVAITIRNPQAAAGTMLQAANVLILDAPAGTLNGPVQAVDVAGNTLTIFGARVQVTPATKINSLLRGSNGTLAQIKAGDLAIVEVTITGSALIAESIYLLPPVPILPTIPDFFVQGTVKSIGATTWVITTRDGKDVSVIVNSGTRIEAALKVGDSVNVVGRPDASGTLVALSITKADSKRRSATSGG